jgi:hypothetical protein
MRGGYPMAADCDEDNGRFDYDGFWKDLIQKFFYQLLKRAVPELYEAAATDGGPPKFLDKEFSDILNTGDPRLRSHPRFADTVAEVPLKGGGNEYVILHIEAQGPGGADLAWRMNVYRCLIVGHYLREPAALAIITASRPRGEEKFYSHSRFGTECAYHYNNLALAELDDGELLSSENPIDYALYAAKCAARSREDGQKFNYLRTVVGILAEKGWDKNETRDLLLFMERILYIRDRALARRYNDYRLELAEEGKVMYIPFYQLEEAEKAMRQSREEGWEKGLEKGMKTGLEKGKRDVARAMLRENIPMDVIKKTTGLSEDEILKV